MNMKELLLKQDMRRILQWRAAHLKDDLPRADDLALEELLTFMPTEKLIGFLPEDQQQQKELEVIREKRRKRYACMSNEELIDGIEKFVIAVAEEGSKKIPIRDFVMLFENSLKYHREELLRRLQNNA